VRQSLLRGRVEVEARPAGVSSPLDPKPRPLNYRREEETGLYFRGDYNLRGRTPKADVDVCFNGNIGVSQVKLLWN
jgi:5'-nucleotidase